MLHNAFLNAADAPNHVASYEDANPTLIGSVRVTYKLPSLSAQPRYERLALGGWQVNGAWYDQNGTLISYPGSVTVLADPAQIKKRSYQHYFNTCYINTAGVEEDCANDSYPAFQQRLSFTTQPNNPYMNLRTTVHPKVDLSAFKTFEIFDKTTFEIRGEFFNAFNTPIFGGPNTTLGNAAFGQVTLTQANAPRTGQLTARINW